MTRLKACLAAPPSPLPQTLETYLAAFTDQFVRWPSVKLSTSLSGSKLVSKIGLHAYLATSEPLSDETMASICRAAEARSFKAFQDQPQQDEFDKFRYIYQQIEQGFSSEGGLPFGVKPEQACAAVVFWKLADAQDCVGLAREAQLAYAIDFLTLGVWLSTQYRTSEKDAKLMTKKLKLEKKQTAKDAINKRWEGRKAMVDYANELAQAKVWDSIEQAAGIIFPKVKAKFPDATFTYKEGAVADWIRETVPTARKLRKAKPKI